jgi:outer membrane protein assembly factor BamB
VGSPLIVDSRVIVATGGFDSGSVVALSAAGEVMWRFDGRSVGAPMGPVQDAPAYHEGLIYVTTTGTDGRLYVIEAATGVERCHSLRSGGLRWPTIVDDVLYLSTAQGAYAIRPEACRIASDAVPEGRLPFYSFPGSGVSAPPVVVGDLMIVPAGPDLVAIDLTNPNGSVYEWQFASGAPIQSAPVVAGDVVYFGNEDGTVFTSMDGSVTAIGPRSWTSPTTTLETDGGSDSPPTTTVGPVTTGGAGPLSG